VTRDLHFAEWGNGTQYGPSWVGPRYRYGYRNRPFAYAHQPDGFLGGPGAIDSNFRDPVAGIRHGWIDYPFELTEREVDAYELVPMGEVTV
jgi:hypothetical protein